MQELTTSITDHEVIQFFMETIVPHVQLHQKPLISGWFESLSNNYVGPHEGCEHFVSRLGSALINAVDGESEQVYIET